MQNSLFSLNLKYKYPFVNTTVTKPITSLVVLKGKSFTFSTHNEENEKEGSLLPLQKSESIIRPEDEFLDYWLEQEKRTSLPSIYSFNENSGKVAWNEIVFMQFLSPMDFVCFWEFFIGIEFLKFFPQEGWSKSDSEKRIAEILKIDCDWDPFTQDKYFQAAVLISEYIVPLDRGHALEKRLWQLLLNIVTPKLDHHSDEFSSLYCAPVFYDYNTSELVDTLWSCPFEGNKCTENFRRLLTFLEQDTDIRLLFPLDIKMYMLYEYIQEHIPLYASRDSELLWNNTHLLNLDFTVFFSDKSSLLSFFHKLATIYEEISKESFDMKKASICIHGSRITLFQGGLSSGNSFLS